MFVNGKRSASCCTAVSSLLKTEPWCRLPGKDEEVSTLLSRGGWWGLLFEGWVCRGYGRDLSGLPAESGSQARICRCLFKNTPFRASLVVQWLRIRLPVQGTRVRALVREDPTCRGAAKPVCHNYWTFEPQLLKPARLEPMLRNKRSHRIEKPTHRNKE